MKKLTQEEFIQKAKDRHNNFYDYSKTEYINSRTKVCVTCPKHGDFWQLASAHLNGQGCPECFKEKKQNGLINLTSSSELLARFQKLYGDQYEYNLTGFEKQYDKINIYCKKHKHHFSMKILHHLNGHGCPLCSKRGHNYSTEEFIIRAKEVHGDRYDYSKVNYVNRETPIEIICKTHGSFWQKPHNHISGCGCPKCKATKVQYKIYSWLKTEFPEQLWEWEYSPIWLTPQVFDIYCEQLQLAIEYNGEQHYMPISAFGGEEEFQKTIERDKRKSIKCSSNNCTLYVIKYDELNFDKLKVDILKFIKQKNHENH